MGSSAGRQSVPNRRRNRRPVIPAAEAGLNGFLLGSLTATRETIERMLALQRDMMEVVSQRALDPAGGAIPRGPDGMNALVGALQSDDLIRQSYENLLEALAVMARAVEESQDLTEDAGSQRQRWEAELLDALRMDEMRQHFARSLEGPKRR